jgi:hypothetical protein
VPQVINWYGPDRGKLHTPADLAAADVVLTTNSVLSQEAGEVGRMSGRKGTALLHSIHWWRIVADEPQCHGMGELLKGRQILMSG